MARPSLIPGGQQLVYIERQWGLAYCEEQMEELRDSQFIHWLHVHRP